MQTLRPRYHFTPQKGWINDPNGLIQFRGQTHVFFQHNPHAAVWGPMHWGHAVSGDLLRWQELPIALAPDQWYENNGGCWSGSAVEAGGLLWLFYTSVSHKLGQTVSVATSADGIHFEKHAHNPVIRAFPPEGSGDFRDPKVLKIGDTWHMALGSGKDGVGKILRYTSKDLLRWDYAGVLYESAAHGPVLECPDFFPLSDRYVLLFSRMNRAEHSTIFVVGNFNGQTFLPLQEFSPEAGPHFYAPQTFLDHRGRRLLIAWCYSWAIKPDPRAQWNGALTIPREVNYLDGRLALYPVEEARHLLRAAEPGTELLRDGAITEGFINGGERSFTRWERDISK
ncbi:MAG: glycoside hydrolase family 32 protein [Oscillospiraceae bacterium]|jgi:beta-fructofuranosidase|nr:glycoside hydrolase family 32 protein [Oscillospiraceae bacterium]